MIPLHNRLNKNALNAAVFICITMVCWAEAVQSTEVIISDTTWHGERIITGDLIIPDGVTLTISSGSKVYLTSKQNTGTPTGKETPLPRILVQGHLEVEGDEGSPVVFSAAGENEKNGWAGIIIDDGNAWLHEARIQGAATAVYIKKGWVKLKKSVLTNNCCGVVINGADSGTKIESSTITENDYGLIFGDNCVVSILASTLHGNREKNILSDPATNETGINNACLCDFSPEQKRIRGQGKDPDLQQN